MARLPISTDERIDRLTDLLGACHLVMTENLEGRRSLFTGSLVLLRRAEIGLEALAAELRAGDGKQEN